MKVFTPAFFLFLVWIVSCNERNEGTAHSNTDSLQGKRDSGNIQPVAKTVNIHYKLIGKKDWQIQKDSFDDGQINILNAVNRTDTKHLQRLDSVLIPNDFSKDIKEYLPFPPSLPFLKDVNKIILFSYPTQTFAAYENGSIIYTGPTSMGRKNKPTPQRLYFTNWKAKETISTVDDAWKLKWNFNVHNTWGVGFHEYELPGYPASHSCMRLSESDAKKLYYWADQWIIKNGQLAASGTPVVVFGKYLFGSTKPWYKLANDPQALQITTDSIQKYITPYLPEILKKQQQRQNILHSISTE